LSFAAAIGKTIETIGAILHGPHPEAKAEENDTAGLRRLKRGKEGTNNFGRSKVKHHGHEPVVLHRLQIADFRLQLADQIDI
jgi:hypothetical protein